MWNCDSVYGIILLFLCMLAAQTPMYASRTSQPKRTGFESTGRARSRAVHLMIGQNCCLSAILIQNSLACMQISYEYKMQTVILRSHEPAGPPWLLRDFKKLCRAVLVWICSVHNETLWDTIARYLYEDWCRGTSASCIQVAPKPSGPVGRVALEGRIGSGWGGGGFSTVVV